LYEITFCNFRSNDFTFPTLFVLKIESNSRKKYNCGVDPHATTCTKQWCGPAGDHTHDMVVWADNTPRNNMVNIGVLRHATIIKQQWCHIGGVAVSHEQWSFGHAT
jgi:hypothetical protein